jgi:hypothetical protein
VRNGFEEKDQQNNQQDGRYRQDNFPAVQLAFFSGSPCFSCSHILITPNTFYKTIPAVPFMKAKAPVTLSTSTGSQKYQI